MTRQESASKAAKTRWAKWHERIAAATTQPLSPTIAAGGAPGKTVGK
jgi:hypothetical protein